jgi:hypothetical protein
VRDHLRPSRDEVERHVRLRLGSALGDRRRTDVEAGLLHIFERVAVHAARRDQVADGHPTLRQIDDAGQAVGRTASPSEPAALVVAEVRVVLSRRSAFSLRGPPPGSERLEAVALDELLADRLDLVVLVGPATGHLLLELVEAGLRLIDGDQRLVGLLLGALGERLAFFGLAERVLGDRLSLVELLVEVRLDLLATSSGAMSRRPSPVRRHVPSGIAEEAAAGAFARLAHARKHGGESACGSGRGGREAAQFDRLHVSLPVGFEGQARRAS